MRRSKHQAVYKYLPEVWASYRDDDDKLDGNSVTIKIEQWNYREITGVFTDMIEAQINRNINMFYFRDGNISSFKTLPHSSNFKYVESARLQDISDIMGSISPLVFYCASCGNTISYSEQKFFNKTKWTCSKCHRKDMKQLQFIYACQCGSAYPVRVPFKMIGNEKVNYLYKPTGGKNNYKFIYKKNGNTLTEEMIHRCDCGKILYPSNASDGRNYRPFTVKTINLIDNRNGVLYKYGSDAHKIILANSLTIIDRESYEEILNNIEDFFKVEDTNEIKNSKEFLKKVNEFIIVFELEKEEAEAKAFKALSLANDNRNFGIQKKIDREIPNINGDQLEEVAAQILEFNTIKNSKRKITLNEVIDRQIELEVLSSRKPIDELNERFGIKTAQVSIDIEIITSTFGYTRKYKNPKHAKNGTLQLKSYREQETGKNLVYCSKLDTEGILIEIDKIKVIKWLLSNKYIKEYQLPDLEDEISVNKWFIENVKANQISDFDDIDVNDPEMRLTYYVYNLLHIMSHSFIKSAGLLSGLDKNSIAELIFPNLTAIFIYANTTQGIPLGVLSGMFEENYKGFIYQAKEIMGHCVFDPICMDRDKGACSACAYLSEVSCSHFNKDLSRKFLIGEKTKDNKIEGFWDFI